MLFWIVVIPAPVILATCSSVAVHCSNDACVLSQKQMLRKSERIAVILHRSRSRRYTANYCLKNKQKVFTLSEEECVAAIGLIVMTYFTS